MITPTIHISNTSDYCRHQFLSNTMKMSVHGDGFAPGFAKPNLLIAHD